MPGNFVPDYDLGARIKQLRKRYGMRQEDFARPLGVATNAVSLWERTDQISLSNLQAVAAVHCTTPEERLWLFTGERISAALITDYGQTSAARPAYEASN